MQVKVYISIPNIPNPIGDYGFFDTYFVDEVEFLNYIIDNKFWRFDKKNDPIKGLKGIDCNILYTHPESGVRIFIRN